MLTVCDGQTREGHSRHLLVCQSVDAGYGELSGPSMGGITGVRSVVWDPCLG